jgi:hypothetical protein
MGANTILASFAEQEHLLDAVQAVQRQNLPIVDVYSPYVVHGLDQLLGWRRSQLSVACFLGGAAGAAFALWFQFWTTAVSWPLNVGGQPWNSLPAFVPATFEMMVLLAGFTLLLAWLFRSGLYPGKKAVLPLAGVTDDRFVLVVRVPSPGPHLETARRVLMNCHATDLEEGTEEEQP